MDVQVLRDLEQTITKDIPKFSVRFKDESPWMKVLGFLSYPFNPKFMTSFSTTLGSTVYFPTRAFYEQNVDRSVRVLTHEYMHLWDKKQHTLFDLSYLFPQILGVIPLLVFGVLAWPHTWLLLVPLVGYMLAAWIARKSQLVCVILLALVMLGTLVGAVWLTRWSSLAFVAGLLCLAPWPSPGRTKWELRGYTMSVAVGLWLYGAFPPDTREAIVRNFIGPNYYFMWWFRSRIDTALDESATLAQALSLQGCSPPYATVYDFLYQHSLLRR